MNGLDANGRVYFHPKTTGGIHGFRGLVSEPSLRIQVWIEGVLMKAWRAGMKADTSAKMVQQDVGGYLRDRNIHVGQEEEFAGFKCRVWAWEVVAGLHTGRRNVKEFLCSANRQSRMPVGQLWSKLNSLPKRHSRTMSSWMSYTTNQVEVNKYDGDFIMNVRPLKPFSSSHPRLLLHFPPQSPWWDLQSSS